MNDNNFKNINPNIIYKEYNLTIPIDLEKLSKSLNITLDESYIIEKSDIDGEIYIEKGNVVIWVNPLHSEVKSRFTLAHELGHYANHLLTDENNYIQDKSLYLGQNNIWDIKEYVANQFAAKLLMPIDKINEIGKEIVNNIKHNYVEKIPRAVFIEKMAKRFLVSNSAMEYRLLNLHTL